MAKTQSPTRRDYELAEAAQRRMDAEPNYGPTAAELEAINRILVQQARERLEKKKRSDRLHNSF